jgi:hypothetical protein
MQLADSVAINRAGKDDGYHTGPMTVCLCDNLLHFIAIGSAYPLKINHLACRWRHRKHRRPAASRLESRQHLGEVITQPASGGNIHLGNDDDNVAF